MGGGWDRNQCAIYYARTSIIGCQISVTAVIYGASAGRRFPLDKRYPLSTPKVATKAKISPRKNKLARKNEARRRPKSDAPTPSISGKHRMDAILIEKLQPGRIFNAASIRNFIFCELFDFFFFLPDFCCFKLNPSPLLQLLHENMISIIFYLFKKLNKIILIRKFKIKKFDYFTKFNV